jgi:hypothetical protein
MRRLVHILMILLLTVTSCGRREKPTVVPETERAADSIAMLEKHHYTYGTNFELQIDSIDLECLPIKDTYTRIYRDERVVVAEFAINETDSVDSVWVKLAHSQERQGWIREKELLKSFVPTDSISESIYAISRTHLSYFIIVISLFFCTAVLRAFMRKKLQLVYFNDIDSAYPMALCLITAFSATLYESIQIFAPDVWVDFYFNPTLSPFQVPFVLSVLLSCFWLYILVFLAAIDDSFRQLSFGTAIFYMLGVSAACICCYTLFIFTTHFYVGYILLAALAYLSVSRFRTMNGYKYRCGRCGERLKQKGVCPHCGALNE